MERSPTSRRCGPRGQAPRTLPRRERGFGPRRLGCAASEFARSLGRPPGLQPQSTPCCRSVDREHPLPTHPDTSQPLQPSQRVDPVLASPKPAAVCIATPRLSGSFPGPRLAVAPRRCPRSSDWSPTTWHETRPLAVTAYPGKSFLPLPISDTRNAHTARAPIGAAKLWRHRSANTETLLASAGGTDTLGRLARCDDAK